MSRRTYSSDDPFGTPGGSAHSSSFSSSSPFSTTSREGSRLPTFDPLASPPPLNSYRFPSSLPPFSPLSRTGSAPSGHATSYGYPGAPQDPVVEKRIPSSRSRMSPIGPPPNIPLPPLPHEAGGSSAGRRPATRTAPPSSSTLPPLTSTLPPLGNYSQSSAFRPSSSSSSRGSSGSIGFSVGATPPLIDERSPLDNTNSVFCSVCDRFRSLSDVKLLPSNRYM